jgi:hypothetical protein
MNENQTDALQKILNIIVESNHDGGFGAVIARAGVGKTALLVQIALYRLFEKKSVLHVSLKEPINKVCLWYDEVSKRIERTLKQSHVSADIWDTILMHRMIMTFGENQFNTTTFRERLSDLTEQGIFYPQLIIVDGLMVDKENIAIFEELKKLAKELSVFIWFSIRSHRHKVSQISFFPPSLIPVTDLFDVTLQVIPKADKIDIELAASQISCESMPKLILNPETMLIQALN